MMFNNKIGIDLGTTNILVYLPNKGIVVQEPSVVAVESSGKKIMAIGKEAYDMLGRTPDSVTAVNPLLNGAIANFRVTEAMLKYYINQVIGKIRFTKPEVMISIPAGITSTEKRAVIDATINAGAKNAYLIKEPIAAALGANIKISTPSGHMIIILVVAQLKSQLSHFPISWHFLRLGSLAIKSINQSFLMFEKKINL